MADAGVEEATNHLQKKGEAESSGKEKGENGVDAAASGNAANATALHLPTAESSSDASAAGPPETPREGEDENIQPDDEDEILKQGFLTKKIPQKQAWKPAWFVLRRKTLSVYSNAWAIKPRAVFRITRNLKLELQNGEYVEGKEVKTCFKIFSAKKELVVLAQSMDEMQAWMEAIVNAKRARAMLRTSHRTSNAAALFSQIAALRAKEPASSDTPIKSPRHHSRARLEIRTAMSSFHASYTNLLVLQTRSTSEVTVLPEEEAVVLIKELEAKGSRIASQVDDSKAAQPVERQAKSESPSGSKVEAKETAPDTPLLPSTAAPKATSPIPALDISKGGAGASAATPLLANPLKAVKSPRSPRKPSRLESKQPDSDEDEDDDYDEDDDEEDSDTDKEKKPIADDFSATLVGVPEQIRPQFIDGEETEEDFTFSEDVSVSDLHKAPVSNGAKSNTSAQQSTPSTSSSSTSTSPPTGRPGGTDSLKIPLRGRASSFATAPLQANDAIPNSPPSPRAGRMRRESTSRELPEITPRSERKPDTKKLRVKDATALDLSRRDLQSIPSAVCKNKKLVVLNLYSNILKSLPSDIGKLTQLTQLGLNENLLSELPKEIGNLRSLEILDLRFNRLKKLPSEIQGCTNLKKLFLRFNKLTDLPSSIGKLESLELLSIRNNNITTLPPSFVDLKSLKVLDAHQNTLKSLPPFGNLKELVEVNLQCNQLTGLPEDFGALSKLQRLHLGYNKFAAFPVELEGLKELQELDLEGNLIPVVDKVIGSLVGLRTLYLNRNKIRELPESIGNLTQLKELHLNGNQLKSLPSTFGELVGLKEVDLSTNQFTELPDVNLLKNVHTLKLVDNGLTELPASSGQLTSLRSLNASENRISEIHEEFFTLTNLTELKLICNELTTVPPYISNLLSLKVLALDQNMLEELPTEIGEMPSLSIFSIADNYLNDLPNSIAQLRTLSQLKVDGNPLKKLPAGIVGGSAVFQCISRRAAKVISEGQTSSR